MPDPKRPHQQQIKDAQAKHLSELFGEADVPKPTTQQADAQAKQRGAQLSEAAQAKQQALGDAERQKLAELQAGQAAAKAAVQATPSAPPAPAPADSKLHELSRRNDLAATALDNMRRHARQSTPPPAPSPPPAPAPTKPSRRAPSPEELDKLLRAMAQRAARRGAPASGARPGPERVEADPVAEAPPEAPPEESPEKNQEQQTEIIEKLRARESKLQTQVAAPTPQPEQERAVEAPVTAELTVETEANSVRSAKLHDALEEIRVAQRQHNPEGTVHGVTDVQRQLPHHPLYDPPADAAPDKPARTAPGWLERLNSDEKKVVKKLERVLLEVRIPRHRSKEGESGQNLGEQLAVAEQLFTSLHSLYRGGLTNTFFEQDSLSFEIAASDGTIGWFVGVPLHLQSLVEKQIHAYFADAEITPVPFYNIFTRDGYVAASSLALREKNIYPIRTFSESDAADPMSGLVNALSKIAPQEGAAIQIMLAPTGHRWRGKGQATARQYAQGRSAMRTGTGGKVLGGIGKFASELFSAAASSPKQNGGPVGVGDEPRKLTAAQEELIEKIEQKASKVGFEVVIRLVSAASDRGVAEANLDNLKRAFGTYTAPDLNGFKEIVGSVQTQAKLVTRSIFRELDGAGKKMILNAEELANLWHPPTKSVETPHVRWLGAKAAPPPSNIAPDGLLLGYNQYRGQSSDIRLKEDDRRRHLYAVGKTGMGKTTLLENMIIQDIRDGKGLAVIDPHGDLAEKILMKIPRERAEDVIYFDPGDTARPMAFNMLDYKLPEQKDFVVQETVGIFYKLFGDEMIGPKFEHWTRNGILTLMEDDETGAVLFDLPRLFSERDFAAYKISKVKDPVVKSFWAREMAQTSDFHKSEMLGYFISKFGRFITNEMMRNIIGQPKSAFDIRQVMDEGKILIMNLSKGKTGEMNSALLGMIAVSKVQMAAMSRVDIPEEQRKDFYLYVDEFQNLTNEESIQSILSEARKYRLNLVIAHQYIAQLEEKVRDAVFGNVGTAVSFRVGADDAEYLEKQFEPVFDAHDLINLEKANAYVKLIIDGLATRAFNMKTYAPEPVAADEREIGEAIRQLSRLKFGRDQKLVDYEIRMRSRLG